MGRDVCPGFGPRMGDVLQPRQVSRTAPRERHHDRVARRLAHGILSGKYQPGAALPTEQEGCHEFGVSRTSYREAVKTLAAKGFATSRVRHGTHVTPRSRWNLLDPQMLEWSLELDADDEVIRYLLEFRALVEPAIAGLAARNRSVEGIAAIRSTLETMTGWPNGSSERAEAEIDFHRAVLAAARNAPVMALTAAIATAVRRVGLPGRGRSEHARSALSSFERVLDAIAAGNEADAVRSMELLIRG